MIDTRLPVGGTSWPSIPVNSLVGVMLPALVHRETASPNGGATVADGSVSQTATLDREKEQAGARGGEASRQGDPSQLGGKRKTTESIVKCVLAGNIPKL